MKKVTVYLTDLCHTQFGLSRSSISLGIGTIGAYLIKKFGKDKIISVKSKDNFWSMGESGPCGPCTEIFYDYGDKFNGSVSSKRIAGDRYVEIWNLVFMEFNQIDKNKRLNLNFGFGIYI